MDIINHPEYRRGVKGTKDEYKEYLGQNELVLTITFMVLFQSGTTWKQGMIAFTSTQLKVARIWSKAILAVKIPNLPEGYAPPIFSAKYHLTTFADSNAKGGFYSWKIVNAGVLNPETDQALLEQAFEGATKAQLALPKPQAVQALTEGEAKVVDAEQPY
jgi:hypothetical protein